MNGNTPYQKGQITLHAGDVVAELAALGIQLSEVQTLLRALGRHLCMVEALLADGASRASADYVNDPAFGWEFRAPADSPPLVSEVKP